MASPCITAEELEVVAEFPDTRAAPGANPNKTVFN